MAVEKHGVRYLRSDNIPILSPSGDVRYILHRTVDVTEHRRPRRIPSQRTSTLGQRLYREEGHSTRMLRRMLARSETDWPATDRRTGSHRDVAVVMDVA